ncbi:hypothetical protein ACG2LH_00690 [Zhouia sp. PK063]|uniref:hypothetical protein n=1 Tax=Zhouia sp. PK063 TaxID=3373602 RepID=UPI00379D318E
MRAYFICIVLALVCLTSCVKDVDFDQYNDIIVTPVVKSGLMYGKVDYDSIAESKGFTIPDGVVVPPQLVDLLEYRDTIRTEFLYQPDISSRLLQFDLGFYFNNTAPFGTQFNYQFLDENYTVIDSRAYNIPYESEVTDTISYTNSQIENIIKNTHYMAISIKPDVALAVSDFGNFSFKSNGTLYFELHNEK